MGKGRRARRRDTDRREQVGEPARDDGPSGPPGDAEPAPELDEDLEEGGPPDGCSRSTTAPAARGAGGSAPRSRSTTPAPAERHAFEIGSAPGEAGERLDRYVAARLPDHSRAEVQRWILERRIRLRSRGPGGMRVDRLPEAHTPLRAGDALLVEVPPPRIIELRPERIGLPVLYDDDTIMVVDKPPGLVSHPSPGHASGTLANALLYLGGDLSRLSGDDRPGLVHRLDRDTSGVMVIARTDAAHRALCHQFKHRETEKEYVALTEGAPARDEGEVDAPIARHPHDRQRFAVLEGGRSAQTRFRVERRFLAGRFALVSLFPRTGRTHQIRVHLAHLRAPVLCDGLYGRRAIVYAHELEGRGRRRRGEKPLLARHALHARRLAFTHPKTGTRVAFESPLPADMESALEVLRRGLANRPDGEDGPIR